MSEKTVVQEDLKKIIEKLQEKAEIINKMTSALLIERDYEPWMFGSGYFTIDEDAVFNLAKEIEDECIEYNELLEKLIKKLEE